MLLRRHILVLLRSGEAVPRIRRSARACLRPALLSRDGSFIFTFTTRANGSVKLEGYPVIGLHTVFEHHDAMGEAALRVHWHKYRVPFTIRIDRPAEDGDSRPATMWRYAMQGTPKTLLIECEGRLGRQSSGHLPDLRQVAGMMALTREDAAIQGAPVPTEPLSTRTAQGCTIES